MRWTICHVCHNFVAADEAAIASDKVDDSPFVCRCDRQAQETRPRTAAVFGDLKPYKNIIDGKVIDGRREHKQFLKRHGVVENADPPAGLKERLYEQKHGAKHG